MLYLLMSLHESIKSLISQLDIETKLYVEFLQFIFKHNILEKECKLGFFEVLPNEILLNIFKRLNPIDGTKLSYVCKTFYNIIQTDYWWNLKIKSEKNITLFEEKKSKKWNYLAQKIYNKPNIGYITAITRWNQIYNIYQGDLAQKIIKKSSHVVPHGFGCMYRYTYNNTTEIKYKGEWKYGKA